MHNMMAREEMGELRLAVVMIDSHQQGNRLRYACSLATFCSVPAVSWGKRAQLEAESSILPHETKA